MKKIALLCNPTQGAASKALPIAGQLSKALLEQAIPFSLYTTQWPADFQNFTEVWIIGGDGTLNYFLNHYIDNTLPLVIFPGGSGNDFHWALYGNLKLEEQVKKVLEGQQLQVDAGTCNSQWFINGVGIGFDGAIVHDLLGKNKRTGKASYLLSILKHIVGYREKACIIQTDTHRVESDCFMISVANGKRYGGGFLVAPRAVFTDGLLDISIVGKILPLKRLRYLPVIEKGEHLHLPFMQNFLSKKVLITSPQPLHAHIDGEYISSARFDIQVSVKKIAFVV